MIFIKALILILVVYLVLIYFPMITYLSARLSGIKIHAGKLLKYRIKKVPIGKLVRNQIILKTNGFDLELSELVELYQEGVDLENVTDGLVFAKESGLELTLEEALVADKKNTHLCKTIEKTLSNVDKKDG